ncbi:prolyl oligopeptidase family serine peptidase [Lutibacter sp. A64]|uniref:alpha/beta hydrolase family protein n=1 Tax=Lutibacter sp. A64 TaxID=2918526 RepID=UPI001F070B57|nr:prolyl oligopeptidase family serine peptidase [Lutibacter sp. A64]UMB54585.1 prolyl oligopeptidase family serine peptidase [Lutibacter sp. A64]
MRLFLTSLLVLFTFTVVAQKKVLDHKDYKNWNAIKSQKISSDGNTIMYLLEKGEKDSHLKIKNNKAQFIFEHERAENPIFANNAKQVLFTVKPWKDSIKELKRKKVKKDKLPKDTLAIYTFKSKELLKISNVKSYKIPKKEDGFVAYLLEDIKAVKKEKDTSKKEEKSKKTKKAKKVGKDNGYHLVLRDLTTTKQDTFKFVTNYTFAKEGKQLAFITTGVDSTVNAGVYVLNLENKQLTHIFKANKKTKYYQLNFSDSGKNLGFVADLDTTKVQVRPNELYHWSQGDTNAKKMLDAANAPKGYRVSSDGGIYFSKDESKMYFGLATPPIVKDTTLLDEEIVNVEVWTYNEPRLYTVQEMQVKNDTRKSYTTTIHLATNKLVQLSSTAYPNVRIGDEGNAEFALVNNPEPYLLESQWTGNSAKDYAIVNTNTGAVTKIFDKMSGRISLSPKAKYAYGYNSVDSTWFAFNLVTKKMTNLTKGKVFYDELNDAPVSPRPYGSAGWTEDDASILLYDRYDIWEFNPENGSSKKLTNGRAAKTSYRYIKLDREERFLDKKNKWLLYTFNETTKNSGYFEFNPKNNKGKQLLFDAYDFSEPIKAKDSDKVLFTKQTFEVYPNIIYSDLSFKKQTKISNANPQQSEYNWGTAELVNWTSLDGDALTGMLIKPENFDPSKKYPMIVNFYEKSSDGLFRHKAPSPGRSTISYSFYASRGYLIFNPDVNYKIGAPGESAYNCVIPGIESLIEKGFVDKDNIGVQGHSWGGYQIAHLVTKTNIFKAAESGAPVVNMVSAYGGIRWWTGLSRQFQYEHTQSRLGGTPWEYPERYLKNSPIFNLDKINTPLLIMHNDADGHVPWYQGIEFFVSLRRLGKPSWMLNYNEEPHWPLKMQNRIDFNIRMQQFFDHYLKGAPMPVWMKKGVPAIEKGINQGYELLPDSK